MADKNTERGERGRSVVTDYGNRYGEDGIESTLRDVLADLIHAYGPATLDAALAVARRHYFTERAGLEE